MTISVSHILLGVAGLLVRLLPPDEGGVTGAAPLIGVERPALVGGAGESAPQTGIVSPYASMMSMKMRPSVIAMYST